MKKILISLFAISSLAISFAWAFNVSGCQEKRFIVTAYYSPQSGQAFYYKENFQDEITLNGEWYTGASGRAVFNGMLAWPATYSFWSIIYFPELGIGEIADRGWAIVLSWERGQGADRIDVWMGKGEEWLIRALTFGKKTMTGFFCDRSLVAPDVPVSLLREKVPLFKNFFDVALRIQHLEEGREDIRTRTLQKYLVKLWYLNKQYRNWKYEVKTKKALCKYQVAKRIVWKKNADCGVFGKMTRYSMKMDMQERWLLPENLYAIGDFTALLDFARYYNWKPSTTQQQWGNEPIQQWNIGAIQQTTKPKIFMFYKAYSKGQQSSEIKILQAFLQTQWCYSGNIDGIYSKGTANAVYEFQKKCSLISDKDPLILRGFLGPKTRSKINELRQRERN